MKLSIIIPMLNEAQGLPGLLQHLFPLQRHDAEIIMVDGGSTDGSAALAESVGFTVLHAGRSRARQMNAGASTATGDALLFLHADTRLPDGVEQIVSQALADNHHVWGRFDVRIEGRSRMLRVVAALMNLRSRLTGIATGDQAMFMTREAFSAAGGFPEQPLMEDIELSKRLLGLSPPACISRRAITSGRRWESRGIWRTIFLMWRLRWAYWRGAPPEELAKAYR
ncbi:MAG: TIGR04283 family arsenosugar biosynthesis glycosyltransferase [Sphingomonadaceae bacterium]|nr:TIGR04283 family arsenosugar biosynthesis glycosyltransferase [Sphingomonadaceae bacterium]